MMVRYTVSEFLSAKGSFSSIDGITKHYAGYQVSDRCPLSYLLNSSRKGYKTVLYDLFSDGSGHNTTGSTSSGPSVGGPGNKNGCPVFDTSCPAGCAAIDVMGCLSCTCTGIRYTPFLHKCANNCLKPLSNIYISTASL